MNLLLKCKSGTRRFVKKKDSNFFFRKIVYFYDHYGRLSDLFSVFNLTVTICL